MTYCVAAAQLVILKGNFSKLQLLGDLKVLILQVCGHVPLYNVHAHTGSKWQV